MWERLITHDELMQRIDALGRERRLIGPVAQHTPECDPPTRYFYRRVQRASQLSLDFSYCVYSPKEFVLPPHETLFTFDHSAGTFVAKPVFDDRPTAIIGVHPCDLHALRLLDRVFEQDRPDEHYAVRRRAMFIVGIDCPTPCTSGVSCADWHTNEATDGFDVHLYPLHGPNGAAREYGVVFGSDAGRAWLANAGRTASTEDQTRADDYSRAKSTAFPFLLNTPIERLPGLLQTAYDSNIWQTVAQRCYSCGSCNLVCPTCYCFDIQDDCELGQSTQSRSRSWDSCMLPNFAAVAGGHNFRSSAAQRLRHRVMRKASWIHKRSGLTGCVGCGRCDRACTAAISLVEMLNQIAKEADHAAAN